jgi:hypothetical protein
MSPRQVWKKDRFRVHKSYRIKPILAKKMAITLNQNVIALGTGNTKECSDIDGHILLNTAVPGCGCD